MVTSAFKTVLSSVRPARVAVLIDQSDEDWQSTCCRIIEFFSGTWGGAHNIIVPTDGRDVSEIFWEVLDAFDADYFYHYHKTGKDLMANRPREYEQWLDQELQQFLSRYPTSNPEDMRAQIDETLLRESLTSHPSTEFQKALKTRLAPFHGGGHAIESSIVNGSSPAFPIAALGKVLANCDHSGALAVYEPAHGACYPLWLASITGLATEELRANLAPMGIHAHSIPSGDYDGFEVLINSGRAPSVIREQAVTPFQLANVNLSLHRSKNASWKRGPVTLVAGETVHDFCLYYALSRLRHLVFWMPQNWLRTVQDGIGIPFDTFASKLQRLRTDIDTSPSYVCSSVSVSPTDLEYLMRELGDAGYGRAVIRAQVTESLSGLLQHPLRVYERDNVDRASSVMVREGSHVDFFETPKPKNFSKLDPYEHRWITEVTVLGHRLPRHPLLGNWVLRHPLLTEGEARIDGQRSMSYFCPSTMYRGWGDIDTTLVRPTIFIPSALQIFEHIFKDQGFEARLSDKGLFAEETIRKAGSLDKMASLLRDAGCRKLFFKCLDYSNRPLPGVHDEGAVLADKRRYLNFPALAKLVGTDGRAKQIIEVLLNLQIMYRGFVFKCRLCRNSDWFATEEVSQVFRCKRCGKTQGVSAENYWYGTNEPGWFYKLDEIVYQFLHHNGYITLLALDHLRRESEDSFLYTPDLDLATPGSRDAKMELDIMCIRDGHMILGEAKKENKLGRSGQEEVAEIRKYSELAKKTGAEALVFATFGESWSDQTQYNIRNIIDRGVKVILLANPDLLGG